MSTLTARHYRYGDLVIFPGVIQEDYELAHHRPVGSFIVEPIHTGWRTLTAEFKVMGGGSEVTALRHQLSAMAQDTPGCSLRMSVDLSVGGGVTTEFQLKLRYHENDLSLQPLIQALTRPAPEEA